MHLFHVSLTLWITPTGDAALDTFTARLRQELLRLHDQGVITAPFVTGPTDTHTCQVTLSVHAEHITAAPVAAGRAVGHAADIAAPTWRTDITRVAVQPTDARPATLADLPPIS